MSTWEWNNPAAAISISRNQNLAFHSAYNLLFLQEGKDIAQQDKEDRSHREPMSLRTDRIQLQLFFY